MSILPERLGVVNNFFKISRKIFHGVKYDRKTQFLKHTDKYEDKKIPRPGKNAPGAGIGSRVTPPAWPSGPAPG